MRDFGLEDYNLTISLINNYISLPPLEHQAKDVNRIIFQRLLKVIIHLIVQTKPDIAYTTIAFFKYINNTNNIHWQALKQI